MQPNELDSLTRPGRHRAAPGLYLYITKTGGKSWVQRVMYGGKQRDIGLGGYPEVPLVRAIELATDNKATIARGGDPLAERKAKRAGPPTFEAATFAALKFNRPQWRAETTATAFVSTLERYAFPAIGDKPVDQISRGDVARLLDPIWHTKAETAKRCKQYVSKVLQWATNNGHCPNNVVRDLDMGKQRKRVQHHRSLPYERLADALRAIDEARGTVVVKACVEFMILTACRSGDARGARWSEVDFDAKTWTIPGERMKSGRPHRVPLSPEALAVLKRAHPFNRGGLVFPSPRTGNAMDDSAPLRVIWRIGLKGAATPHGMRATFRRWARRNGVDRELAELSIAHLVGDATERSYTHADELDEDLIDERRAVMDSWAKVCRP